ncbi:ABC transporter, putative [Bodo saltans]|uniref:ABC transporter, putative n=1 Tax=Bodo saltans TaxID=75058 RepID=A0A0S4JM70_BODSA|nr:ABC transporter, putative [Bodo saltans]|eukprot:CUG91291.1 ABC transporter, putative [Bodo saltans]
MRDAIVHFFAVTAAVVSISSDLILWWMASRIWKQRLLPTSHYTEVGLRFVVAFTMIAYAAHTQQQAMIIAYISAALASALLWLSHCHGLVQNKAIGETQRQLIAFAFSILLAMGIVILFLTSTSVGCIVVAAGFAGLNLFSAAMRSVGPQARLQSLDGDEVIHGGRLIAAALWLLYGCVEGDMYVALVHTIILVTSSVVLFARIANLTLPPKSTSSPSHMWGAEPLYNKSREDDASLWDLLSFAWVKSYATAAADETLTSATLPPPLLGCRTWDLGRKLEAQMKQELDIYHLWDSRALAGDEVSAKWDTSSRGNMRWVGCISRSPNPTQMMVGIEWTIKPTTHAGLFAPEFHNGTFEGEFLFAEENKGSSHNSSCIPADEVVLLSSADESAPRPQYPSVVRALFTATWSQIWVQAPFRMIADICMLSSPVVLEAFVKFLKSDDASVVNGVMLAVLIFVIGVIQSSLLHRYYHLSIRCGIAQRNAVLGVLFTKCFSISPKDLAHPDMGPGRVVNMVSSDAERFNDFQQMLLYFWSYPFQVVCGIALLYRLVGWCAVGSIVALSVSIPLQKKVAQLQHTYRLELVKTSDLRVKLTNELFGGIRVVKFMGWELNFLERLEQRRSQELVFLKKAQYCRILAALVTAATPTMLVAVVFILYYLSGNTLTPEVVFPTISVLNILRIPFIMIPNLFTALIQFSVAATRVTKFLMSDDQSDLAITNIDEYVVDAPSAKDASIVFENATLCAYLPTKLPAVERILPREKTLRNVLLPCVPSKAKSFTSTGSYFVMELRPLLKSISLRFPKGKLTVILGPTGSGKSTLLEAVLGQLYLSEGKIATADSIGFVPQQPWIMNATVKENIEFFSPADEKRLATALRTCQLDTDLHMLPGGLDTEIGERGVNLSGGQRARVSMARAVYARRDVYLLDDPLSALDAHVGAALLNDCILDTLAYSTRVLATHHAHVLPKADYIIELNLDGSIKFSGTYPEYSGTHPNDDSNAASPTGRSPTTQIPSSPKKESQTGAKLTSKEEKASGSVPLATYIAYFNACGGLLRILLVVLVFLATEFLIVSNTIWLSLWSVQTMSLSQTTYLLVYLLVITIGIISAPLRYRVAYDAMRKGSFQLHAALLRSVIRAPMSFFDTTPLGRILNRFVQDIDQADNGLQLSMVSMLQMLFSAFSTTLIMLVSQPGVILVILPCFYVYYRLLVFYNAANREARRIGNVVKSPVFSLLTEVLNGVKTICAFKKGEVIMLEAEKRLDVTYSAAYLQNLLNRWLRRNAQRLVPTPRSSPSLGNPSTHVILRHDTARENLESIRSRYRPGRQWTSTQHGQHVANAIFSILNHVDHARLSTGSHPSDPSVLLCLLPSPRFLNAANREARRIGNVVKSPVFSLLTEVLNGVKTICAFKKGEVIMLEAEKRLDVTYSAAYLQNLLNRWLGLRIELLGTAIIGTVALGTALSKLFSFGTSNVAVLSLGLTMSTTITTMLNWMVRQVSAVESDMNSIERILYYSDSIEQENLELVPCQQTKAALKDTSIVFKDVDMKYRADLPLVLQRLSFNVNCNEKVGVVGRTGSGKSSLLMTFLRIVEICGGSITIGGVAASSMSLAQLRGLFSMIPQDPILFDGTIRSNLDPFGQHGDADVVEALALVGMQEKVFEDPLGIQRVVLDGGSNFSVGQRQLLCMARAILKKGCEFILMDEATANIDPDMDARIQSAVKTAFATKTVVTIAHRIQTIASYDKIIVMDRGEAVEIGPPQTLFLNPTSSFRALVDAQEGTTKEEILGVLDPTRNRSPKQ